MSSLHAVYENVSALSGNGRERRAVSSSNKVGIKAR